MRKRIVWITLITMLLLGLCACGKKKEKEPAASTPTPAATPTVAPSEEPTPTPVVEETREGQLKSKLTGLWIDEKAASKRPYAVMINNIGYAGVRHCGISQAEIIYEAIVEGGITRCMAIFESNFDAEKIGSVRSARHYFVSIADEYDAIFCHFGHTKYATAKIKELGVNNISALAGYGTTAYYRDNSRAPHNAFASAAKLKKAAKKLKYRTKYEDNYPAHFGFYDVDTDLAGDKPCTNLTLSFSSYKNSIMEYDVASKTYKWTQYKEPHMDNTNKTQLSFKNVIVEYIKERNYDRKGYQTMDFEEADGSGWYITNGTATKITWKKSEKNSTMRYYDQTGAELTINPGKTYVCLFPKDRKKDVKIK